jgi:signal transduction histidine kinase/ligand-binding sensor domain-containing protein
MRRVCCSVLAKILLCCFAAGLGHADAPGFVVDVWKQDDGVPGNNVIGFGQSAEGYLWMVSDQAVARFDGERFVEAEVEELSPTPGEWQGPLRYVRRMFGGGEGALWLTTNDGALWGWQGQQFENWFPRNTSNRGFAQVLEISAQEVLAVTRSGRLLRGNPRSIRQIPVELGQEQMLAETVCRAPDGEIWFLSESGQVGRINSAGQLSWPWARPSAVAGALAVDLRRVWVGTEAGLRVYRHGKFEEVPSPSSRPNFPVRAVLPGPGDLLWVSSGEEVWSLNASQWYGPYGEWPRAVPPQAQLVDRVGRLWLAVPTEGLHCIGPDGSRASLGPAEGLAADSTALFCDREGSVWASIYRVGIARIRDRRFTPVRLSEGMHATPVWNIAEDGQGSIWFSPEFKGPVRWTRGAQQDWAPSTEGTQPSGWTKGLTVDRQGRASAAFMPGGIFYFAEASFQKLLPWPEDAGFTRVLYQDRSGVWWMGSDQGLHSWAQDRWKRWAPSEGLPAAPVRAITEDPDGHLWVGTFGGGLARWEGNRFVRYDRRNGLCSDSIYTLCAGTDGSLWAGTREGLARWKAGRFTAFRREHGLPDNRVVQILDDGQGCLWLGTRDGLCRVTVESLEETARGTRQKLDCLLFDRDDGLPTRVFQDRASPACWQARDGRLWFLTAAGPVFCWPDRLRRDSTPPPIQILDVLVDGRSESEKLDVSAAMASPFAAVAALRPGALSLSPGPHVVEIRYAAPTLAVPERVTYQYQMQGLDPNWLDAGSRQTAVYSVLPPGRYRFRVRARNHDGVWSEGTANLALVVQPYLWQRAWFPVAVGAALVTASGLTFAWIQKARMRNKLARLELQQAKEAERTRISRDLHDHLGSSLTRISMLAEEPVDVGGNGNGASHQLRVIREKVNAAVGELDALVWAVDPQQDTLPSLGGYLASFAEDYVNAAGLGCRIEVPRQYSARPVASDVRHHLFLAVKEAVHNAVRHAGATEVLFQIRASLGWLHVRVEDNGTGFDMAATAVRRGSGLTNLRERLALIGGRCDIQTELGKGTTISFVVPLPESSNV